MALFDDPKKELRRLQEQLLAEEEEYQEEEVLEELLEEYSEEADLEELFEGDYEESPEAYAPRYRNFANDYGRAMTEALWEEEQDAERVVYSDDYEAPKKKKKKGIGEVILLILLDIVLIGILLWGWQQWMG